jgi:cbb3-type cytochrome oxidase maturation protein
MTALAWLIPAALLLGLFGLMAFMWALRSGQFDDLEGAAYRILEDDDDFDLPKDDKSEVKQEQAETSGTPSGKS